MPHQSSCQEGIIIMTPHSNFTSPVTPPIIASLAVAHPATATPYPPVLLPEAERFIPSSSRLRIEITDKGVSIGVMNYSTTPMGEAPLLTEDEREYANRYSSMCRTRRQIRTLGIANDFDWWCTFTFPAHIRNDIAAVKKISEWMGSHARHFKYQIAYLAIVVPHEKGGWHVHMLMRGVPSSEMHKIPFTEATKDQQGRISRGACLYHWMAFSKKYKNAVHEIQRIGDLDQYGKPITQIGKAQYMANQYNNIPIDHWPPPGTRKLLCSRGLSRPSKTICGNMSLCDIERIFHSFGINIGRWGGSLLLPPSEAADFVTQVQVSSSWQEESMPSPPFML